LKKTQKVIKKFENRENIYVHREVIIYSRENRPMEMLTLTSEEKITKEREALIEGCFPDAK
jgi:hypothetical protein